MVLKVLTDPGQVLYDGDAVALQFGLGADPGLHQHLGGVDRAKRQHHFGSHSDAVDCPVVGELHTGDAVAVVPVECHPGHQRTGEHGQVGSRRYMGRT